MADNYLRAFFQYVPCKDEDVSSTLHATTQFIFPIPFFNPVTLQFRNPNSFNNKDQLKQANVEQLEPSTSWHLASFPFYIALIFCSQSGLLLVPPNAWQAGAHLNMFFHFAFSAEIVSDSPSYAFSTRSTPPPPASPELSWTTLVGSNISIPNTFRRSITALVTYSLILQFGVNMFFTSCLNLFPSSSGEGLYLLHL